MPPQEMFQNFESTATPDTGPARLAALRALMADEGLQGFIIPRADAHQGEYVAAHDARLRWLSGFTGSAGFCIALADRAGIFVDGRYRTQVRAEVDLESFTPLPWPETEPGAWIRRNLTAGRVGFDPWLHTAHDIDAMEKALAGSGVELSPVANLIDRIWQDQPPPPLGRAFIHPLAIAGKDHATRRHEIARILREAGDRAAVLTLPDSICWLLNIRGADVPRTPVVHAFAIIHADARVDLFAAPEKFDAAVRRHLGDEVTLAPPGAFDAALQALEGPVRVDPLTAPLAVSTTLAAAGQKISAGDDPCRLPKACKNAAELAGMRAAHLRDGAAMVEFLAWLDAQVPESLDEIAVVTALEGFRRKGGKLHDLSFDTICGSGPNGAIIHYRVTRATNRQLRRDEMLLVDSGAQYADGTTDITRTIALGTPDDEMRACATRVLTGMIALARARWPRGLAGRDLDPLARHALWTAGLDFDHGTGHGVGAFLSVHEGPQRISRLSEVPLVPGMIVSDEPGYYREGAFGIRFENLLVVQEAPALGDHRAQLSFETLTLAPFDRRLILADMLAPADRAWLEAYHADVLARIGPLVSADARAWLAGACAPI